MDVRIAILIPVHRHAVLASEAIASALDQLPGPAHGIVVVNDGCPMRETREMAEGWAARAPGRVRVVHQANRGLSAARNTAIETALALWPGLEAVFFLDADNRLDRTAVPLFARLLESRPDADWFFPNFDFFGIETYAHNGAAYSPARMSVSNQCEAGSLVRRRVLDAGLRFAETMRAGYEDWDFWLQASAAGFRGARIGQGFFRYRKRPESMLSGSHAGDAALRETIAGRHRWLYARDGVLRAALAEGPYILRVAGGEAAWLEGATLAPRPAAAEEVARLLFAAHAQRQRVRVPPFVLIARPPALDLLADPRRGRSVICHLQDGLAHADLALLRIGPEKQDGNYWFADVRRWPRDWMPEAHAPDAGSLAGAFAGALRNAEAVMVTTRRLVGALGERTGAAMMDALARDARLSVTDACLPVHEAEPAGDALRDDLAAFCEGLAGSRYATPARDRWKPWRWPAEIAGPMDLPEILSEGAVYGAPLLLDRRPGRLEVGFAVPILKFGGVEKCAIALARALREAGAGCHLFVYGNQNAARTDWLYEPFETVHLVGHKALRDWSGPRYLGTNLASRPPEDVMNRILGPLSGLDVVVNSGCAVLHHGLGALRRKGVRTVAWEHLVEGGPFGRSYGTPYLALAYEGAYDRIATCSHALADWMHGHGVPHAKILPLPNGPGFPMTEAEVAAALAARQDGAPERLRVGFLGRMDWQKGLDRFLEIAARAAHLPLDFSVTGKPVLEQSGGAFAVPDTIPLHPPAYDLDALRAAFARLDILLMPSRDEGLPLTIMEAQRVGVVPIASRVGAVAEAIADGETGFTVPPDDVVGATVALLERLSADRDTLARLSARAAVPSDAWAWNARAFLAAMEA